MKPDTARLGLVEVERLNRFLDVGPEFAPRAALRENAFGQALRAIAAVRFLRHLENDFSIHTFNLVHPMASGKRTPLATGVAGSSWSRRQQRPPFVEAASTSKISSTFPHFAQPPGHGGH